MQQRPCAAVDVNSNARSIKSTASITDNGLGMPKTAQTPIVVKGGKKRKKKKKRPLGPRPQTDGGAKNNNRLCLGQSVYSPLDIGMRVVGMDGRVHVALGGLPSSMPSMISFAGQRDAAVTFAIYHNHPARYKPETLAAKTRKQTSFSHTAISNAVCTVANQRDQRHPARQPGSQRNLPAAAGSPLRRGWRLQA